MPIPLNTPEPGVPVIVDNRNPWEKYKAALAKYQQMYQPTPQPAYEQYGAAPQAPTAPPQGGGPGMGALAGLAIAKGFGGGGAAASSGLGAGLGAGVAGSTGTLAQAGAGLGMKGATLGGTTTIAPAAGGLGALPIAGIGIGALLAGKAGYDMFKGKTPNLPGRILLGVGTGGLSEIAKATGVFGHKSTGERQSDRWKDLAKAGSAPDWAFANGINQDQGFGDRDLKAGIDPRKVWASSAMFDTFGKDWATTGTENQRAEITKQILANNLIDTKQGVSYMLDKDKANSIKAGVLASILSTPQTTRKDSPGFKDGKRISYK